MPRTPQHIAYDQLPRESRLDGTWQRAAVRGDHSLVTYNWMDPAMPPQPPHSHDFDQVSMIVSGAMEFTVADRKYLVEAGQVLVIPASAPHTGVAVGDEVALNIDVYAPPRADYLYLTDHQGGDFPDSIPLSAADTATVAGLVNEWAHRIDHGDAGGVAELLSDDAVVTGLGPDRHGPAGIQEWADARPTGRQTHHQVTNLRYGARPDGTITGTAYLTLYVTSETGEPATAFVGEYRDTIRRTPDGLQFTRRDIVPLG
ncbi:nuclear transport factor 2 family protein [Sciscionella marina]|uniref:nuclear transport factor 2 family protein n=1 Tax=Sciscionella marina TaxID=508770 RepID=UPI00037049BB|nr:nuclear transport factor 2 family protein [Sciscionella marina]